MKFKLTIPVLMMAAVSLSACSDKKALLEEAALPPIPSEVVKDVPDWCLNMPVSEMSLFACGIGSSADLTMARSKATLDAKRQLADILQNQISTSLTEQMTETSTSVTQDTSSSSQDITVRGYQRLKEETISV